MTFDKEMKKKKVISTGFILILAGVICWLFRPYPTIDESRVHPSLRGLDDSAVCEWTSFADGGSLILHVIRSDGSDVVLSMSNSLDHSFYERGQLYIGADHFSLPGSTKITGYDHTKYVVAKLLNRNLTKYPSLRGDIAILTKRVPDWISFMIEAGLSESFEELRFTL